MISAEGGAHAAGVEGGAHADDAERAVQPVFSTPFQPTGHSGADAVLADLEDLAQAPVQDHPAAYQAAHDKLTAVLDAPVNVVPANVVPLHHG
ncbi:hypothetical protein [Kocuria sp.]|uniref:hypothetical protein n=1 Tax=Kocuria sp. TaxID=1871328 RepID=UPI0026DF7AE5|nr:hypothetical protein [Kocuria sp.]MDO5619496.1 hypothetical protein [Kocuria sp.]